MTQFAQQVLDWYVLHGRHDLPWQKDRTLYRVWVSEIMLQQTQVNTVIPYFQRFTARFPDVISLANASIDEVLHLWTGLGYYARARNLHRAAQTILDQSDGIMPTEFQQVLTLPGIGRSTAGAILTQALGQRHPILDGNVKRVLTRFHAIQGWPGSSPIEKILWEFSEAATPKDRCAEYTQAIMDLGATICTRGKPACTQCPLADTCKALAQGAPNAYPSPRPRKPMPVRQTMMLLLRNKSDQLLLEQRPPAGIWGGLWSFPECPTETDVISWCGDKLDCKILSMQRLQNMRHTFSHFHLDIQPIHAQVESLGATVREPSDRIWYDKNSQVRGFPAPVKQLIDTLK